MHRLFGLFFVVAINASYRNVHIMKGRSEMIYHNRPSFTIRNRPMLPNMCDAYERMVFPPPAAKKSGKSGAKKVLWNGILRSPGHHKVFDFPASQSLNG